MMFDISASVDGIVLGFDAGIRFLRSVQTLDGIMSEKPMLSFAQ